MSKHRENTDADIKRIKLSPETRAWISKIFEERENNSRLRKHTKDIKGAM